MFTFVENSGLIFLLVYSKYSLDGHTNTHKPHTGRWANGMLIPAFTLTRVSITVPVPRHKDKTTSVYPHVHTYYIHNRSTDL